MGWFSQQVFADGMGSIPDLPEHGMLLLRFTLMFPMGGTLKLICTLETSAEDPSNDEIEIGKHSVSLFAASE